MLNICIIIRTLNPHRPTLARVLDGLRRQTYPRAHTELLIIDNASQPPLDADALGLEWHPGARVIREETPGKAVAQRRGIREAASGSELLLFVDDDNLLREDYLATGARMAEEFPQLGAWGSGSIRLEFEQPPPDSVRGLTWVLTAWDYPYDVWSSLRNLNLSVPAGAGMFVRRNIAQRWVELFDASPIRQALWLHRTPAILFSEDTDLALTAPDLGLGTGIFRALHIDHLVRAEKVSAPRLLNLVANQQCAEVIIKAVRGLDPRSRSQRLRQSANDYGKLLSLRGAARRAQWHRLRGQAQGRRIVGDYLARHPEQAPAPTLQPFPT